MTELAQFITVQDLPGASAMVLGFVVLLFAGSRLIPARRVDGTGDADGGRRFHVCNGLTVFFVVVAAATAGQLTGWFPLSGIHDRFWALFLVANVFAFAMTFALFVVGRQRVSPSEERHGIKAALEDLYFGVERDPAWLGVDLKMFSYRPSLIGLMLINASFAAIQYENQGTLSAAMVLYQVFTFVYILNYFQFEHGMIFTWDVVAERFGWMLVWGDYVLVPFFYSLPGWFLIDRLDPLPPLAVAGLVALYVFGFWLFRGANDQKHRFKQNPSTTIWGRPADSLEGRLLVSGFWGIGRHLNYTGEICIFLAFTMTAGFDSMAPYLLPAWLVGLLVHRAWRDDRRCRAKYGELWAEYTDRVQFKMVPFLY